MNVKRVLLLGSTGSIGKSTISVCEAFPKLFRLVGISAHTSEQELLKQAEKHGVSNIALSGKSPESNKIRYSGREGLIDFIKETEADITVNGISGAVGLIPSKTALESGKDLALANKETMVMAGTLINDLAAKCNKRIIPVDSEHSALFFLLKNRPAGEVSRLLLTASGGAFRDTPLSALSSVTVEEALKHPTWNMGPKITIDSATMANKGLEVIEAEQLFGIPVNRIQVVIHPQSRVHSLIQTLDGTYYAQLSGSDMRLPIQNALTYPHLVNSPFGSLDLAGLSLDFRTPDPEKYPLLEAAYVAADKGGGYPIAYNASNETAVEAFLKGRIGFTCIASAFLSTLAEDWQYPIDSFDEALEKDRRARDRAEKIIKDMVR